MAYLLFTVFKYSFRNCIIIVRDSESSPGIVTFLAVKKAEKLWGQGDSIDGAAFPLVGCGYTYIGILACL